MANSGYNWNFMQLLENHSQVVIPIIQRDYAQGRAAAESKNSKKKDKRKDDFLSLCQEVREEFVSSLKNALVGNIPLVLDYIYGSKVNGTFSPIDGQQRLTTLFLLHWYIAVKEKKLTDDVKQQLAKFIYETRDTSLEFCQELIFNIHPDIATVPQGKLAEHIKNSRGYYSTYDADPTVMSMLVMLDALHCAFCDVDAPLWDRLKSITFWVLDLDDFELTDDLFVKMNARGKRLSRFDVFKSDLEAALKKAAIAKGNADVVGIAKTWITEIDNSYLDIFWNEYGKEYAERNMFRLCMFLTNCLDLIANPAQEYDESWERNDKEMGYKKQIAQIAGDETILTILCKAMATVKEWRGKDEDDSIDALLLTSDTLEKANEWEHYLRARVFGKIYWYVKLKATDVRKDVDYKNFERILLNYLYSYREYNIKTGQFASRIDKKNIAQRLYFIKTLVDNFAAQQCDFTTFIRQSTYAELEFEREKLRYSDFVTIVALEEKSYLGRNIQNVFFNGTVYISPTELDEIVNDKELSNLALRIVFSHAQEQYGQNAELAFDRVTIQTPGKLVYVDGVKKKAFRHIAYIGKDSSGWGNKVLSAHEDKTAQITHMSEAVKGFVKDYHAACGATVREKLDTILQEKIDNLNFSNDSIIDYLVKYREFYQDNGLYVLLTKKWDSVNGKWHSQAYDLYCVQDSARERLDTTQGYYQPFYKAIENKLKAIKAIEYTLYNGVMDVSAPYKLSNGWSMQIQSNGDFKVYFNGKMPPKSMVEKYGINNDEYTIEINAGEDCIENVSSFLNEAQTYLNQ